MERNSDDDSLLNSFWKLNPHGRDGETEDESSCSGNRAQDRSKTLEIASNCSGMKRSSSEFEFQAFLRMKMANSGGNEDQSLTEDNNGGIRAEKARICGDFGTLFSVDGEKCFENVCGSGLGEMDTELKQRLFQNFAAVYGNRDTVNSYSTCAQVTSGLGWSENLNPRHSSVAATIESQSSICGPASMSSGLSFGCTGSGLNGSPTSPNKPKSGDCQVRTATSGSSREQSDDDDLEIETGQCEQSMGNTDLKRMRRMVSNRESARRSRRRKQAQLADLEFQVDQLKGQNASLHKQLIDINQKCGDAATNNQVLRSDVEALRATVKMAEDMVSRENAACNVNHQLFQSRSIPPRHLLNARYLSRPSEVPAATDESGYASSITVSGRIPAIGTETGGTQNPIIRNKLDECLPLQRIASLEQLQNRISAGVGAASCGSELWP